MTGERPFREGSFRLEVETIGPQTVIHNYGHGGAGITMSQGCVQEVLRLAMLQQLQAPNNKVAVLGAGVMGMASALALKGAGLDVTLYAEAFTPHTTSDVAGGQWSPSVVSHGEETRFQRLLKDSYSRFVSAGPRYGVSFRDNYTFRPSMELSYAALSGAEPAERMRRLPFLDVTRGGYRYPTLLVEPPIYLKRMHGELRDAGVAFVRRSFSDSSQVGALDVATVVNCMGLGSRRVWQDPALQARKGVLAMLPPQPELRYLYSGIGYMFPRADHLVIGGSIEEEGTYDTVVSDEAKGRILVKIVRAVFQGALPAPLWLSGLDRISDSDMR